MQVPVRVDHELTALGLTLVPVLGALEEWSETHLDSVLAAREAHDARVADAVDVARAGS